MKQKYIVESLSASEISTLIGCDKSNVFIWLRKHGIAKKKPSINRNFLSKEWLENAYIKEKKTPRSISNGLNCSESGIRRWLKKYNIKIRSRSESKRESLHHHWKGGITEDNLKIRNSHEYRSWRTKVFHRDNFTCQVCGSNKGGTLNADHIKPFCKFPELRFDINNGRTLCEKCHKKTETFGRKALRYSEQYALIT